MLSNSDFHVLIVENSRTTLASMTQLLEENGITVSAVRNGEEAIQAVQTEPFDLVLMDLYMPRMNGYEAASSIRSLPGECGEIPIIALTASTDGKDINVCKEAGMNEYFIKSMGEEELIATIDKYRPNSLA